MMDAMWNMATSIRSKHTLVNRVRDWPCSSFHRDARAGLFPEDWGGDIETTGDFGERR
jgi:putative transposase